MYILHINQSTGECSEYAVGIIGIGKYDLNSIFFPLMSLNFKLLKARTMPCIATYHDMLENLVFIVII